jgi:hypothetical protein
MNSDPARSAKAVRASGRSWMPMATAVFIATAMVWLAGAPLQAARFQGAVLLEAPPGDLAMFPHRFAWAPVPGADTYEITVVRNREEILFRQRGPSTVLDVSFDAEHEPPPGRYVWEVQAMRGGQALGAARGEFRVAR